jgi:transposase InsO family protein
MHPLQQFESDFEVSSLTRLGFFFDKAHQLWVLKSHLLNNLGVSENAVREGLRDYKSGKSKAWLYTVQEKGATWILYESIPQLTKQRVSIYYEKQFPNVPAAARQLILRGMFEAAREPGDIEFFLGCKVKLGERAYTNEQATDLALACGILRQLDDDINNKVWRKGIKVDKNTIITDGNGYIQYCATVIKSWKLYGFNVGVGRVLYKRIAAWVADGRRSLISDRFGKANALKITEEIRNTAIVLMGSNTKPTIRDVAIEVGERFNLLITPQTLGNHLKAATATNMYLAPREGKVYAEKQKRIYISHDKPRYADEVWYVDGTTVQLMIDDEGQQVKLAMNRITVFDGYSQKRVGVAYGITETAELVWQALYFAFKTTGRLPTVLKSDKGSANTRTDLVAKYNLLGITHLTSQARRSTSNRAIEYNQHQHERFLQRMYPHFAGGNFMGRGKQMRFNPDTLKTLKHEGKLPTWLEAVAQDYVVFMAWNSLTGKDGLSPNERYGTSFHPERRTCSTQLLVNAFTPRDGTFTYQNGQILFKHRGETLTYWVGTHLEIDADFWRQNDGNTFKVRFNSDDPSLIGLYSEQWEFKAVAYQKHKFAPNPKAMTTDERTAWRNNLAIGKALITEGVTNYQELKADMTAKGELTYIDWETKTKAAMHADTYAAMGEEIEHLGILDKDRQKRAPKSPKGTFTETEQAALPQTPHFFEDDAMALALSD